MDSAALAALDDAMEGVNILPSEGVFVGGVVGGVGGRCCKGMKVRWAPGVRILDGARYVIPNAL